MLIPRPAHRFPWFKEKGISEFQMVVMLGAIQVQFGALAAARVGSSDEGDRMRWPAVGARPPICSMRPRSIPSLQGVTRRLVGAVEGLVPGLPDWAARPDANSGSNRTAPYFIGLANLKYFWSGEGPAPLDRRSTKEYSFGLV